MRPTVSRGEVGFRIEHVNGCQPGRVLDVEHSAHEQFIQKPRTADRNSSRRAANEGLHFTFGNSLEDALENQQIEGLATQRKRQLIGKRESPG